VSKCRHHRCSGNLGRGQPAAERRARFAQLDAGHEGIADAEFAADQFVQRDAAGDDVAARVAPVDAQSGFAADPLDLLGGDQRDLRVVRWGSRIAFREVAIAADTAAGDQFGARERSHRITGAGRDAIFMARHDAARLGLAQGDAIALVNELGRYTGHVFLADMAPGNIQVLWPEGNVIIRRGVVDKGGGVPDYNALVRIERIGPNTVHPRLSEADFAGAVR